MPNLMILILVLSQCKHSTSFICKPCSPMECVGEPKAEECMSGQLTSDVCGCCKRCASVENEICGSQWGMSKFCADYLYCQLDKNGFLGLCKPSKRTSGYKNKLRLNCAKLRSASLFSLGLVGGLGWGWVC